MSADQEASLDEILAEVLGLPRAAIRPDLSGESCERWDSTNHIRIVLAVEERFGVRLSLDELETSMSRRALLDILRAGRNASSEGPRR